MGIDLDNLKNAIQAVKDYTVSKSEETTTVSQAQSQSDESVFSNVASSTVIVSDDYGTSAQQPSQSLGQLDFDSDSQMESLISTYYSDSLSDEEKNSVAWSIVDNNRWMMDSINTTYKISQVTQDLCDSIAVDDISTLDDSEVDALSTIATAIVNNDFGNYSSAEEYFDSYSGVLESDALDNLKEAYGNKYTSDSIVYKLENDGYDQFDENVRTDKIPTELIMATDFSNDEDLNFVFCPTITSLDSDGSATESSVTRNIDFSSSEKELNIDVSGLSEDEALAAVEEAIAINYGLYDTDEEGNITEVYSLNSLEGTNILSALGKDEGNNEIFEYSNEDISNFLQTIVKSADDEGSITLYCPDTAMSVIADESMTDEEAKAYVTQELGDDYSPEVSYLHVSADSASFEDLTSKAEENGTSTAMEVLDYVGYDSYIDEETGEVVSISLKEAIENARSADEVDTEALAALEALGVSAIQQIAENNPDLYEYLSSEEGSQLTNEEILALDIVDIMDKHCEGGCDCKIGDGDKVILEDIQYMLTGGAQEEQEEQSVPSAASVETTTTTEVTTEMTTEVTTEVTTTTNITTEVTTEVTTGVTTTTNITTEVTTGVTSTTNITSTTEVEVTNTTDVTTTTDITSTTEVEVTNTTEVEVTNTTDVTTTTEVDITNITDITTTTEVDVTNTTEVEVTNTTEVEVTNTTEVEVTNTTEVEVTNTTEVEVTNTTEVEVTNTTEVEVTNTTEVEVTSTTDVTVTTEVTNTTYVTVTCDTNPDVNPDDENINADEPGVDNTTDTDGDSDGEQEPDTEPDDGDDDSDCDDVGTGDNSNDSDTDGQDGSADLDESSDEGTGDETSAGTSESEDTSDGETQDSSEEVEQSEADSNTDDSSEEESGETESDSNETTQDEQSDTSTESDESCDDISASGNSSDTDADSQDGGADLDDSDDSSLIETQAAAATVKVAEAADEAQAEAEAAAAEAQAEAAAAAEAEAEAAAAQAELEQAAQEAAEALAQAAEEYEEE